MSYPNIIDGYPIEPLTSGSKIPSRVAREIYDYISGIEATIGVLPLNGYASITARISGVEANEGELNRVSKAGDLMSGTLTIQQSFMAGNATIATGTYSQAFGNATQSVGVNSFAQGLNSYAFGANSSAQGNGNWSVLSASNAFNNSTITNGFNSTALGISSRTGAAYLTFAATSPTTGVTIQVVGDVTSYLSGAVSTLFIFNLTGGTTNSLLTRSDTATNIIYDSGLDLTFLDLSSAPSDRTDGYLVDTRWGGDALAFGNGSIAYGNHSFAGGNVCFASGASSFAFGDHCTAMGSSSVAIGATALSNGNGCWTITDGNYGVASTNNLDNSLLAKFAGGVWLDSGTNFYPASSGVQDIGSVAHPFGNIYPKSIKMQSANGTWWTVTISNSGTLVIA